MKFYMQVLIALGLGLKRNWHIFAGLLLGILVGILIPDMKHYNELYKILEFVGEGFISIIQMVVLKM